MMQELYVICTLITRTVASTGGGNQIMLLKIPLLLNNMSPFGPYLSYGVIGYRFFHLNWKDLMYFKQTINRGMTKQVKITLPRWYTEVELYAIYYLWTTWWLTNIK